MRTTFRAVLATALVALLAASIVGAAAAGRDRDHKKGTGKNEETHATAATTSSAAPSMRTIASGLDNPRDLAFGPDGTLYLAQAGHGGPYCADGTCAGFTSRISTIDPWSGSVHTVVGDLISLAGEDGSGATGIDGVSVGPDGTVYGIETESSNGVPPDFPAPEAALNRAKEQLGRLIKVTGPGTWATVADVGGFDFAWTAEHSELVPDQFPDANPYGVLASAHETWVVDAGANTLDLVRPDGTVKVAAFFPNPPSTDAVPTCVERGPDGALYIGELTGGGNSPGSSIVWRYTPSEGIKAWATGLTAVTGCGFGADGNFYAVEFSTLGLDNAAPETGALVRVEPGSTSPTTIVGGLSFPGGFAGGADGALYFSNWSVAPAVAGLGSVERVELH
jgi:hypothetical protein